MALPASGALLAKMLEEGDALFSTRLGKDLPRQATPPFAPIIIRSDPVGDEQEMIADLWAKYPQPCKAISAPVTNIYQYFDHYDVMLKGQGFLYAVLVEIALSNTIRATKVQEFAEQWRSTHLDQFLSISPETQDVFTDQEKELHEEDFLKDVFAQLKCLRVAMAVKDSRYLGITTAFSGAPVPDASVGASIDHFKPVRTISQPLRSSNYGALVQAKRYASAPQPPPYPRPLPQRFHSGQRSISGQPPTTLANVGHFSISPNPMTGAFLHLGQDAWNREAPKHTLYPMAPIGPFHPDVPETMRLRSPALQAELPSSHFKDPDFPTQEQLHPISEGRGHDTIEIRHPKGNSSTYSNHQNRPRGSSKSAIGTPRFFGSSVPDPQPGSASLTMVTGYPQDRNSNVALGHTGAVGPVTLPVFQPWQFVQPEYPRDWQNPTMGNQNTASAPQTHVGHDRHGRRGSTISKRGRMNFSNDARVLEQQDAYRRQEASFGSNPCDEQSSDLPLRHPRQDFTTQSPSHSSLERHSTAHMGQVSYGQASITDIGHSSQGLGLGDYAGYLLQDSCESYDFDSTVPLNHSRGLQNPADNPSPGGEAHSQEEKMRLAKSHSFPANMDGKSQTRSLYENRAFVPKHPQATFVDAADSNIGHNRSGGQGDFVLPQNLVSVADQSYASFRPTRLEHPAWAVGGRDLSQYDSDNLKVTRIWIGGLPPGVGTNEVKSLFDSCGAIADVRLGSLKHETSPPFAFVTFVKADAAAKALSSSNETYLGGRRVSVSIAYKQPFDGPQEPYRRFAESPVTSPRSHLPGKVMAKMQLMDGSMDTSPEASTAISGHTARAMYPKVAHRYQISDQQHTADLQKTPKKKGQSHSISTENTDWSTSSARRIQRSQSKFSTSGKSANPGSSRSSNNVQQLTSLQNGFQDVRATKDGVADGSPGSRKKTTNAAHMSSQWLPANIPECSDNKLLWTMVETSQQESQATTDQGGVLGAGHGSFDRPDSTVYPGSDSTSEATGQRASSEKCHRDSPRSKNSRNNRTGKRTASATTRRKPNSKTFLVEPANDQSLAAPIFQRSVARPKGTERRQQDKYAINTSPNARGNISTGTSTTTEILSLSILEDAHGGRALDQRDVFPKDAARISLSMIQHQSSSSGNKGLNNSTAKTASHTQSGYLPSTRPRDSTLAGMGRRTGSRNPLPKAEVSAGGTVCPCPPQSVSTQSPATTPSIRSQVVGETRDDSTLKLHSDASPSVPNTPKSKHKTAGGLQKKSTNNLSAVMSSSHTLGSGPFVSLAERSAVVVSPPKADDESAFPPLGSSDEDKNKQRLKLSAEVKDYYAAKHADYNMKLRAGVRALNQRDADNPGASESCKTDIQPTISASSSLDRKENLLNSCNDAVRGVTSERAETACNNDTTRGSRDGKPTSSKVTFPLHDTKARKSSPQRRRNGDLTTLDPNLTSPETLGKEQIGGDSDAWALPKGEKRWSVASVL